MTKNFFIKLTILAVIGVGLLNLTTKLHAEEVLRVATFSGFLTHTTSGSLELVKLDDGRIEVRLGEDFYQDGAPDPYLGFGNLSYDESTEFAELKSNNGAQSYILPANVDVFKYTKFYVWCKAFTVPIGVAHLKRP